MSDEDFKYSGADELSITENSLPKYNEYIVKCILASIEDKARRPEILDFGAGIGTLSKLLQTKTNSAITCFEIDAKQAAICKKKGLVVYDNFQKLEGQSFDLIFSSNVLEHIRDDFEVVKQLRKLLKPNGILFTYVPAFNFLWTDMDTKVGHIRRYSKTRLRNLMLENHLQIESIKYVDCLGVLAMLTVQVLGFNSAGGLGDSKSLHLYDNFIWPISRKLDLAFNKIAGKNLMIIATKEN